MKRLPLLMSFVMFVLLCMSLSFWGMQVFKPKVRSVNAPVNTNTVEPGEGQWGSLFGRNPLSEAAVSNYQLKGVVVAARALDSAAILSADGKPSQTIAVGKELSPGVILQEVHETHIVISEGGAIKRVDLPQPTPIQGGQTVFPQAAQRAPNNPQGNFMNGPTPPQAAPENAR
ncbi:MAG: type II secretion system protein N [Pseudomonadota bacterium]